LTAQLPVRASRAHRVRVTREGGKHMAAKKKAAKKTAKKKTSKKK
jgi:hypothetical protein